MSRARPISEALCNRLRLISIYTFLLFYLDTNHTEGLTGRGTKIFMYIHIHFLTVQLFFEGKTFIYRNIYLKTLYIIFDSFLLTADLDNQMKEAQGTTEFLRSEIQFVSQKHLTDGTCLR